MSFEVPNSINPVSNKYTNKNCNKDVYNDVYFFHAITLPWVNSRLRNGVKQ